MHTNTPNHLKKLFSALIRGEIPLREDGGPVHITYLHDEWCDFWNDRGPCNCDVEIGEISKEPPTGTR